MSERRWQRGIWLAIALVTVVIPGCDSPAPETPSTSADQQCPGAGFTVEQFIGDWQEQDGPTTISLGAHGALKSDTDGVTDFGTWRFTRWDETPAKDRQPESAADTCVLWLQWTDGAGDRDFVYVPLKVEKDRLELSYVGRGNTLVWWRSPVSQ
ncbi:hypothetical protein AFM11_03750 [Mycolicibacterium wolinskyi]|uniref:Uncharacterized protein n=1 Tax=Mycolicibacterium wolinskyi TaxID=59750 RepID=A0A132PST8_9MYCO|nr:hypothetical protein [Mycolicibacterium wolinskyi]KWX25393.1 hypothetical protein AFM11_03750 [Mycolicibacterium wolinskyi]